MKFVRAVAYAATCLTAGCQHHDEAVGPAGLPYACADGRAARIYYDGGDPNRMPARLSFEGGEFTLYPVPALNGLRYATATGLAPGRNLVWTAEGDEAMLIDVAADPAVADQRMIVRCARVRAGETAAPDDGTGHREDH